MLKVTKVWPHKYTSGKLLGFADVAFSLDGSDERHMTWKGFKLFQGNDGSIQIGLPSRKDEKGETDEKTGRVKYHPVIVLSKEEGGGVCTDFLEDLRQKMEAAYLALGDEEKGKTTPSNDGPQGTTIGDDLPF
jgi:DNA-binding cell septation regulator SpoVG